MSKIIEDRYGNLYKTPGFWTTAGGVATGYLVNNATNGYPKMVCGKYLFKKLKQNAESVDNELIRRAISDAFEKSGLRKNNVELVDVPKQITHEKLYTYFSNEFPKLLRNNPIVKKMVIENGVNAIENGNNAIYARKSGKILVNIEKLGIAFFHEMGHAINYNQSKFWRGAQKARTPLAITGAVLPAVALCKRKKVEGEKPKNPIDRATTFIKNNIGKLTTLTIVPIVAEELKASQRGNKMAEKLLSPEAFKTVKNTHKLSAISYISIAILAGLGANVANKVKDKIASPKKID